ncbi:MAG: HAD-IA family hydrolase [Acidimicrobiia bacterium]|nr:HAD-IA family hydrolase [Acidimicrobiia bacterium]
MIKTIFFDIGGVILTNGWDRHQRRATAEEFGLDYEEFQDRHDFVAHDFETGQMDLQEYLTRTVFYRERDFSRAAFTASVFAHSQELPGSLALLDELGATNLQLASLNNESREINEHRIHSFGLHKTMSLFLSSCYLGVKKPEDAIYELALQITQRRPEECVFIDDRELNLECAGDLGIHGLLFEGVDKLRSGLTDRGVELS